MAPVSATTALLFGEKGKTREEWTRGQLEQNANGMGGYVSLESERVHA